MRKLLREDESRQTAEIFEDLWSAGEDTEAESLVILEEEENEEWILWNATCRYPTDL